MGIPTQLIKHCAYEELADAIRIVAENKPYLSSQILDTVINDYTANLPPEEESASATLSTRE